MDSVITGTPTVLLVEDYPAGMFVSTLMIEELGYAVEGVTSGAEALIKIKNSTKPYMAILMDVNMLGMDGFETTKNIRIIEREKGFTNTVIAVTAHALAGDRERCLEAGLDDYISKPINADVLAKKLAALI
jgi:two-component system, sensor histidine kinase